VEYLPFGEVWIEETDPATGYIPFRFTSKELDEETGLYYHGARYYEPTISRWMSADPAGWELINPMERDDEGGWKPKAGYSIIEAVNWYAYVSHNPVKYVDPTGEIGIVVVGGAAAVLLITALAAAGISAIILDPENQENMANAAKQIAEDAMRIAEGAKVVIDVLKAETDDVDEPTPVIEDTQGADENERDKRVQDLPAKGEPNSSDVKLIDDDHGQIRDYGSDGKAETDYDFGHDHGAGDPHAHDWDWSKSPPRQPGRPLLPGE